MPRLAGAAAASDEMRVFYVHEAFLQRFRDLFQMFIQTFVLLECNQLWSKNVRSRLEK